MTETLSVADDISNRSGLLRSTSPESKRDPFVFVNARFPCGFVNPLGTAGGLSAQVPESVVMTPAGDWMVAVKVPFALNVGVNNVSTTKVCQGPLSTLEIACVFKG